MQPGVVSIDLRRMDSVEVIADGSRMSVGGGVRLGHLYREVVEQTNGAKTLPAGSW